MSFIDSEKRETCCTDASMDDLEKALKSFGYEVQRTRLQITATHGGYLSTNGHISTITIVDQGNIRACEDIETSKGYMCSPDSGILTQIINCAETKSFEKTNSDGHVESVKHENPTSQKQSAILGWTITGCIIFLIAIIVIICGTI